MSEEQLIELDRLQVKDLIPKIYCEVPKNAQSIYAVVINDKGKPTSKKLEKLKGSVLVTFLCHESMLKKKGAKSIHA